MVSPWGPERRPLHRRGAGEWSGAQEQASGSIRVQRAGCDPEPYVEAEVDGVLADETSERTAEVTIRLDLTGSRDNPETRTDPPGSTPTPAIALSLDGKLASGAGEPPVAVSVRLELAGG